MRIGNGVAVSVICSVIVHMSLAMDGSGSEQSFKSLTSYISILPKFENISSCVATSWDSFSNTVTNSISDDAAFKKLGWPPHDPIAQQELIKSKKVYERVSISLQERGSYDEFVQDCSYINRRYGYCQRALNALDGHDDGVKLALHCIEHHQQVMNYFDVSRFVVFVQAQREISKKDLQDVDQKFAQIVFSPAKNADLRSFIEQATKKDDDQK